jgi:hypothetical protein
VIAEHDRHGADHLHLHTVAFVGLDSMGHVIGGATDTAEELTVHGDIAFFAISDQNRETGHSHVGNVVWQQVTVQVDDEFRLIHGAKSA